jgi:hypothetical protein
MKSLCLHLMETIQCVQLLSFLVGLNILTQTLSIEISFPKYDSTELLPLY